MAADDDYPTDVAYYDSDDEPPAETVQDRMLWRQDPVESKSDWTIEIIVKHSENVFENGHDNEDCADTNAVEDNVQTYHVHMQNLTIGPRRREYFTQVLLDGCRFAESRSKRIRIELHKISAEAFPMLLDCVYSSERDDPVPFTTDNATALYSLAKYFGIRRLQYLAKQFWQADMREGMIEVCETYYEESRSKSLFISTG